MSDSEQLSPRIAEIRADLLRSLGLDPDSHEGEQAWKAFVGFVRQHIAELPAWIQ